MFTIGCIQKQVNDVSRHLDRRWKCMLTAGVLAVLVCTLSCEPYRPVEPLPEEGIVDMHCHIAGIGAGGSGCFISDKFRNDWRFPLYLRSFGVSERELLEKGDGLVIDRLSQLLAESKFVKKAVVLAIDGVVSDGLLDTHRTQVYVPNEFVVDAAARHGNLLFGASVNPYRKDWRARLVWAKAHGAVLVKWIPSVMNIDPSDPKLIPFYEKLKVLKLPLLTHTGNDQSIPDSNDELNDPEKLRLPLSLGVKVIAAHLASTGRYQREGSPPGYYHRECGSIRLARMMRNNPNRADLYADISSLTQFNKPSYMEKALTWRQFSGRLYYGSDYPLINTMLVSPWNYCFRLTPRQVISIALTRNPWDVDVMIKQALGTPTDVFARSEEFLRR
jgi:uncharacterized protein